ncbi:MAG: radical SAM protein [Selenomonadaceae bacterium]|nr:radical SAM protein [Selenomonadaceae bacterium]
MRVSTYEIILPLEENSLLINGLYSAFDIVSKEDAEKITTGKFSDLPAELKERLLLRGHITDRNETAEVADMKLLSRIHKMTFGRISVGLVIMPTYDCNFRCPYCYEQHRLSRGQNWLSYTMTDEMIDAVFSALKNYKERGFVVKHCTFYGGEPFLKENLPVVRKIAERCRELDMESETITNGYDLESYLDFLTEFNFEKLQITIDGVGEINNRRRIHKSGVGTYERILKNINLALERGIKIDMRVNVGRENLHGIKNLIDDLKTRGFLDKNNFEYYFKATNDDINPKNNVTDFDILRELEKIGLTTQEIYKVKREYGINHASITDLFKKKTYGGFSPIYCGSEQGMLVVDPFGNVYACWDFVGKDDKVVGFVDKSSKRFMFNFEKSKWLTRTTDLMEKCVKCPYCFICRGGCAARAEFEHGNCFREDCDEGKDFFNLTATELANEHWKNHHESELSLSLLEPLSKLTEKERETFMTSKSQKEIFDLAKKVGILSEKDAEGDKYGA